MEDRPAQFRLVVNERVEMTPDIEAYLREVERRLNHAMEVTYREEVNLAEAEIADLFVDWACYGDPRIFTEEFPKVVDQFERRIKQHG